MTKTSTQAEKDQLLDILTQYHGGPETRKYYAQQIDKLIATTRRETVEECMRILKNRVEELKEEDRLSKSYIGGHLGAIATIGMNVLDQLPDKQEV